MCSLPQDSNAFWHISLQPDTHVMLYKAATMCPTERILQVVACNSKVDE